MAMAMEGTMICFGGGVVVHVNNSATMLRHHFHQRFLPCVSTGQDSIVSCALPYKLYSKKNGPVAKKKNPLATVCLGAALDRRALDGQGGLGVFERCRAKVSVNGGSGSFANEAGDGLQNSQVSSSGTAFFPGSSTQKRPGENSEGASSWMNVLHSLTKGRDRSFVPFSAGVELKETDTGSYNRSRRRRLLFSSLALILGVANLDDVPGPSIICKVGRALSATVDNLSTSLDGAQGTTSDSGQRQKSPDDVKSWYKYRGEGFVLRIPPGYEDILDPGEEEESRDSSSLYGEKAKEKPFAARFASPDRDEVLSIVVKRASQLRLSFFEAQDISDFGNIKDAAATFVPAGAKLVSARIINSKSSRVPRTYYVYEFLRQGTHFSMTAGVSKGRVFVLGASTPQAKWKDYSARLQLAAATFFLP